MLQTSVLAGGALAGALVAIIIALASQRRRIKEDTVIGIVFAGAFALGMVIISQAEGYTTSLTSFLFGSLTGVSTIDVWTSAAVGAVVIITVALLHRPLSAVALKGDRPGDESQCRGAGSCALLAVTAAVVISVRTVGNILVLALLVTPAAPPACSAIGSAR